MDEKTRDEAITLLLRAVIEIGPSRVGAQTILEAVKLLSKIRIEERYPVEAR